MKKNIQIFTLFLCVIFIIGNTGCKKSKVEEVVAPPAVNTLKINQTNYNLSNAVKSTYVNATCATNTAIKGSFSFTCTNANDGSIVKAYFYNIKNFGGTNPLSPWVSTSCNVQGFLKYEANGIYLDTYDGALDVNDATKTFSVNGRFKNDTNGEIVTIVGNGAY
jgi:hypothetical protein